ncbi:LysR family transcriptional regulator [Porphyrobacter sp. AAP60]|uniref:LysR family transcriptional regulator n=1 Tax=Porphyrobacter sp. AAP60 TaxID=1523423 RepID=UPI0006B8F2D2|nr:LysR family transcriptional regulator [Porphyrobacter sp. AAP60]KPF62226.1 LysR family transcriptional regulator [Porphyrobacter sp. AAP60]
MLDPRLNHVVAVAHGGSFTKAAEIVGLTQSGITKSVADLERELGFAIFFRTSRGALMTEEGRDFVERAERLLDDARSLLQGSRERGDPYSGPLRVGVCPASLEWLLAEPLAALLTRHPGIRYEVIGSSFERMIRLLRNGSVDVALGFDAAFAEWSDVRRDPVGTMQGVLFVRKGHPLLGRAGTAIADLADYDFITPTDSRPYGVVIREIYESRGVDWRKHLHVIDNFSIVRQIVGTSDAIGVTTAGLAATSLFSNGLSIINEVSPFAPSPLACAVRSRWDPKPAVRAFLAEMRSRARTV